MTPVIDRRPAPPASRRAPAPPPGSGRPAAAEAAARRTLRAQVARLERELAALAAEAAPGDGVRWATGGHAGPRLLGVAELERTRDALADRVATTRAAIAARRAREAAKRRQLAALLRDPARHRFVRITRAEIGAPGCGGWASRPRLGLIGMLAGWWQVKVSSGCPLAA